MYIHSLFVFDYPVYAVWVNSISLKETHKGVVLSYPPKGNGGMEVTQRLKV